MLSFRLQRRGELSGENKQVSFVDRLFTLDFILFTSSFFIYVIYLFFGGGEGEAAEDT